MQTQVQEQEQHQPELQHQQQQQMSQEPVVAPIADAQAFGTPVQPLQSPIQGQQMQEGVEEVANHSTPQGAMKLACPFLKYNPQGYINGPFCQSSWHSVRDVK